MNIELLRAFLAWCSAINVGLLLLWWAVVMLAHDLAYGAHSRWFKLSEERFDEINYAGLLFFKLSIVLLNIIPFVALSIVG